MQGKFPGPRCIHLPAHTVAFISKWAKETVITDSKLIFIAFHDIQFSLFYIHRPTAKVAVIRRDFARRFFNRNVQRFTAFQQSIVSGKGQFIVSRCREPGTRIVFFRVAEMNVLISPVTPASFHLPVRQIVIRPGSVKLYTFIHCGGQRLTQRDLRREIFLRVLNANDV